MHLRFATALTLAGLSLPAQHDFDLDKQTAGTLGASLDLAFEGAPASNLGLLMISFNGGPTPLAIVDPGDPRSVQVGTELTPSWVFVLSNAAGASSYSLALPANPAFEDLVLHWQVAMLASSGPTLVSDISNDVVTQTSTAQVSLLAHSALTAARTFGAGFFDRDNNAAASDFIVAGGGGGTLTSAVGLDTTEVYDTRRMSVSPGAIMVNERALHLAVPLNDDRVLIIGGVDAAGTVLDTCEIYDPATDTYSATGSMNNPRMMHGACLLADGRVMVAGGTSTLVDLLSAVTGSLSSSEIYDPATGTWTGSGSVGGRRLAPALTLLSNNKVLVSGGISVTVIFGIPLSAATTTATRLWNPANGGSWGGGAAMAQDRAGHHYNQVTLNDGRVLMTGGLFLSLDLLTQVLSTGTISGAELYDPTANSWVTVNMAQARALHSGTLLPDGRVAICGGAQGSFTAPTPFAGVELFDPVTDTWSTLADLTGPRSGHAACVTADGTLLLFGGQGVTTLASIETLRF